MSYKSNLKIHLIFVTKYRKQIFKYEKLNNYLKFILNNLQNSKLKFNIDILETDLDHLHMIITYLPSISVSNIVRYLKQITSRKIYEIKELKNFLINYYFKEYTLWSDGYFVNSIGNASIETVRKYIENQGN